MDFNDEAKHVPDQNIFQLQIEELRHKVAEYDFQFPVTARLDEPFLSKFLRTKNYVVDEAFKSIRRYYANVKRNLSFINGIRPSDFTLAMNEGPLVILKQRSKGRRVGTIHASKWIPKEMSLRDIQLSAIILYETVIEEQQTQEKGVVVIFDLKGLSFEQARFLTPRELKRILLTGQDGVPAKISEVHIINQPPLYWAVHKISLSFLKEKIRQRIHLHYSNESLHKHIDPAILPSTLGGVLSEKESRDEELLQQIFSKNMYYERFWNAGKAPKHGKLRRKRSSNGDLLMVSHPNSVTT